MQKSKDIPPYLNAGAAEKSLLTEAERHKLLVEWNATKLDHPREKCIHQLFEEQVERTPDAAALIFEDQRLTYRELNGRANRLAHYLVKLGVGPDVLVGVCMERTPEIVVGLLGILKAGGAYVPLDPAYPGERIAYILKETQVPAVLTQQNKVSFLPNYEGHALCVDDSKLQTEIENLSDRNPALGNKQPRPTNLAYVIFTSGSTGQPKGVAIEHRSTVSFIHWAREVFSSGELTGVLASTSVCFDLSVFEIFVTLSWGGKVILMENIMQLPGAAAAGEVTLINTVPSAITELLRLNAVPPSARVVNLAGEPLPQTVVDQLYQLPMVSKVYDLYGPSETTTYSTFALRSSGGMETIGRPIANTQIYLLDNDLQCVPIGTPGELYIGGEGLARGYLHRPDATAERFIPDPFSGLSDARLYKTGDLARYLPDGNIEFLGRLDHQVKIRGFRIELGEIESVLRRHKAIRDVVVTAREDVPGDKRLAAYIIPEEKQLPAVGALREYMKEKLPEYMIPGAFVMLEKFPLTPNGKIDRKALPAPANLRPELASAYVAPQTELERKLAAIWQEVLRIEKIGIHDNFFEAGGYSLLAVRVISRIRKDLQVDLALLSFFEHPTIAGLGQSIEKARQSGAALKQAPRIKPVSRESRRLKHQIEKIAGSPEALKAEKNGKSKEALLEEFVFPMSFAQQRLWFLDQYEPESALYNEPLAFRLSGSLNVNALWKTMEAIVSRHEALRTTFRMIGEQPMQCIAEQGSITPFLMDLTGLPEADREKEAQRISGEEFRKPFDLANGPLFRVNLLRLGEQEHILLMTMHHIITDGWAIGVLLKEITAFYNAFLQGAAPSLPELPIQYADFAEWQREWLQGEILESRMSYWREQLGGTLPVLELPADRPRPAIQTYRGKRKYRVLPHALQEELKALSQREGVTLFMTLLAAFQTLLHRYTGQDDIIVGAATANRNHVEIEGLIGFFVNTLVLRNDLSGNPTFRELLGRVRKVTLDAFDHEDVPFEKLVEELLVSRNMSYNPLFQVVLVLQNAPLEPLKLSGVTQSALEIETDTAKCDLTVELTESSDGLAGAIEYNTDMFDSDTIERLVGHFQTILQGIVDHPDVRLSELPLLTEPERHQLLVEWNATRTDYPRDKCIHELFEQQVEQTPDAVALVFEDQQMTYRELNRKANQLARYLMKLGVKQDSLVGICMERSLEMVVGLLGILKAGGAYAPLDSSYPKDRIAFMVKDTGISVLLTQCRMMQGISDYGLQVLCLDTDWMTVAGESDQNLPAAATADSLAYVMYTSGSTGTPKGVEVVHRGVVRLVVNTNYAKLDKKKIFLQLAPISFDASTFELWAALLNGATCVVCPAGIPAAGQLAEIIRRYSVSTLWLTSSLFNAVIDEDPQALRGVAQLLIGGEQLSAPHVLKAQAALSGTQIINGYGPTENTTFTCCYPIPQEVSPDAKIIPIGYPIANTDVYILDKNLQPVPVGVPGELYTGGDGLARGYRNRPELTGEVFIPHTFRREPQARLYKTGDLVRRFPDGRIEFLQRIDHQVKIRGFRIELGEIESVLRRHKAIRDVVVTAREDVPGDKRLAAYIIPEEKQLPAVGALREYMKEKLPEYMIPGAFVMLEKFPLTPNGKIDRKALPAPANLRPELASAYVAPQTELERKLAAIWQEVLRIEKIGIHDNFFEAGGYSLLAVRVISRIRKDLQVDLALLSFFEHPTIAGLGQSIEKARQSGAALKQAPRIKPVSREPRRKKLTT